MHDTGFVSECYCVSDCIPQSVISSIYVSLDFCLLAILILEHEDLQEDFHNVCVSSSGGCKTNVQHVCRS